MVKEHANDEGAIWIQGFFQNCKILLQNGFEFDHQTGSHKVDYNLQTKKATVPYHKKDLLKGLYYQFLNRQA
ncbi:MAG: type II toxin-antitoxin system HicA family toxin [Thermodesulfovibrionales bacterium]